MRYCANYLDALTSKSSQINFGQLEYGGIHNKKTQLLQAN